MGRSQTMNEQNKKDLEKARDLGNLIKLEKMNDTLARI